MNDITKESSAELKTPFILSLVGCVTLFVCLLLWSLGFDFRWFSPTTNLILVGFPAVTAGLILFIKKPETSIKGGIIVLTIGVITCLLLWLCDWLFDFFDRYFPATAGLILIGFPAMTTGLMFMIKRPEIFRAGIVTSVFITGVIAHYLSRRLDLNLFVSGFILMIGSPAMIAGLMFIRRPETSIKGGIIVLIIGVVSLWAFIGVGGIDRLFHFFYLLPLILAVIGGFLGMKEGEKYYANEILKIKGETEKIRYLSAPLIIVIISFISAIFSVLALIFPFIDPGANGIAAGLIYLATVIPLATISVILNIIGMFMIGKETNPKKKLIEIILIIITWCLIAFSIGPLLLLVLF